MVPTPLHILGSTVSTNVLTFDSGDRGRIMVARLVAFNRLVRSFDDGILSVKLGTSLKTGTPSHFIPSRVEKNPKKSLRPSEILEVSFDTRYIPSGLLPLSPSSFSDRVDSSDAYSLFGYAKTILWEISYCLPYCSYL